MWRGGPRAVSRGLSTKIPSVNFTEPCIPISQLQQESEIAFGSAFSVNYQRCFKRWERFNPSWFLRCSSTGLSSVEIGNRLPVQQRYGLNAIFLPGMRGSVEAFALYAVPFSEVWCWRHNALLAKMRKALVLLTHWSGPIWLSEWVIGQCSRVLQRRQRAIPIMAVDFWLRLHSSE